MEVSYKKLFKMLIDKGINKTTFAKEVGISSNTLAKLSKNENVNITYRSKCNTICNRSDATFK